MKVWIDQDLCTGDGLCEEICPQVFTLLSDGLAYVKEGERVLSDPGGAAGMAEVPPELGDAVREAARERPGECIYIDEKNRLWPARNEKERTTCHDGRQRQFERALCKAGHGTIWVE